MLRTALICLTISPLFGCAADDGVADELAGESAADGEVGKGDGEEAFTYFQVAPNPQSGVGFVVSRPNRATTFCGTGPSLASCYAGSLDWSSSRLAEAVAHSFETRIAQGEALIVRGRLAAETAAGRNARAGATLTADVSAAINPAQPMLDIGNGPDCLYAKLDVANVKPTTASITFTPTNGGLVVQGRLENVAITGTTSYAVACIDGTSPLVAKIARVDITGVFSSDGTLVDPVVTLTGVDVDDVGQPDVVSQMLDVRGTGAMKIVAQTVALALGPVVAKPPAPQLVATEVWVPGVAASDDDVENVFVLAKNRPEGIRERRLNSNRSANIDTIDFTASGASESSIAAARAALDGTGVIFAGSRFLDRDGNVGRTAERFWTRSE